MTGIIIITMIYVPNIHVSADSLTDEEVIQSYYDNVNTKNIEKILDTLDGEYGECAQNIYTDKENITNHIGIFNISNAKVLSIEEISSYDGLALDLTEYNGKRIKTYKVSVNITKYQEDDEFNNGINEVYFILNRNNKIIGCQMLDDMPEVKKNHNNVSLFSYDAPVTKPSSNPSTIKVYRTSTGKLKVLDLKPIARLLLQVK